MLSEPSEIVRLYGHAVVWISFLPGFLVTPIVFFVNAINQAKKRIIMGGC